MQLPLWLRRSDGGRPRSGARRLPGGSEPNRLSRLLEEEHRALSERLPPGDSGSPRTGRHSPAPASGDDGTGDSGTGDAGSGDSASAGAGAIGGPPARATGPGVTAGEAVVETSVRGTQEIEEGQFAGDLVAGGKRLQAAVRRAADARRAYADANSDPIGAEARRVAERRSVAAMRELDDRHEPGGAGWLLVLLACLAFLGDLGFLYSMFTRGISRDTSWLSITRLLALCMSLAIAAVSVALADHAGRQLRPLWSGVNRTKGPAIARAALPIALTVIVSWATWHMVHWRYGAEGAGRLVVTRLPAGLIATFIVALLWMILMLESQRPSLTPLVDPRVQTIADGFLRRRRETESETIGADQAHATAWLELAHLVDAALSAVQAVYITGAHVALEHRARHGIDPALAGVRDRGEAIDSYPTSDRTPAIVEASTRVERRFHHVERALSLLRAHLPAGRADAQRIVEEFYDQLAAVTDHAARRDTAPAADDIRRTTTTPPGDTPSGASPAGDGAATATQDRSTASPSAAGAPDPGTSPEAAADQASRARLNGGPAATE